MSVKMEKWMEIPGKLTLIHSLKQLWNYLERNSMQLQWDTANMPIPDSAVTIHPESCYNWELSVTAGFKNCYIFVTQVLTQVLSNMSL